MSHPVSVKVSHRYQIVVPRIARESLNIQSGDRLLVDVQDGLLILLPQPKDYTTHLAGLHREVWERIILGTSNAHPGFGRLSPLPLHIVVLAPKSLYVGDIGWRADGWVDYGQATMPKSA